MKHTLSIYRGNQKERSKLINKRNNPDYDATQTEEKTTAEQPSKLGSLQVLLSFVGKSPAVEQTSTFLGRKLPTLVIEYIIKFFDSTSKIVCTRLLSKAAPVPRSKLSVAMKALSDRLRPAVFVKPMSMAMTMSTTTAADPGAASTGNAAGQSSSIPSPVAAAPAGVPSAAVTVTSTATVHTTATGTGGAGTGTVGTGADVEAPAICHTADSPAVGTAVAVAVAVPVSSSLQEGESSASSTMAPLHHRRVPVVIIMLACGLITIGGVVRMMTDG